MTYDAADSYARLIQPRYAPIADALVRAAAIVDADDVLELGAGTGVVTKRAGVVARSLVATDTSAEMLRIARGALRRERGVSFQLLDYTAPFPFLEDSFSLVLAGLTFVQDSARALREVGRVLRPRGRLALSMWGPMYQEKRLLNAALGSLGGGTFPSAAPGRAVARLQRLGYRSVKRADIDLSNRFAAVDDYVAYRRGFGVPRAWTREFYGSFLEAVRREAEKAAEPDGSVTVGWTVSILTARAP